MGCAGIPPHSRASTWWRGGKCGGQSSSTCGTGSPAHTLYRLCNAAWTDVARYGQFQGSIFDCRGWTLYVTPSYRAFPSRCENARETASPAIYICDLAQPDLHQTQQSSHQLDACLGSITIYWSVCTGLPVLPLVCCPDHFFTKVLHCSHRQETGSNCRAAGETLQVTGAAD